MNPYVSTFLRGFVIVTLTAMNVLQISEHHYAGAFLVGAAISWVWWRNAPGAAHEKTPYIRACYAVGAGVGTLTGMLLMAWFG
jgi:hypothetical protein